MVRLRCRRFPSIGPAEGAAPPTPMAPPRFQRRRDGGGIASRLVVISSLFLLLRSPDIATALSAATPPSASSSVSSTTTAGTAASPPSVVRWTPKVRDFEDRRSLRNASHSTETIGSLGFHHVEFYCGDAKSTALRFASALGMAVTCHTGQSTGNDKCASYGLASGHVRFLFTAPYSSAVVSSASSRGDEDAPPSSSFEEAPDPLPSFDVDAAHDFFRRHGLAAKAVGIEVRSADDAYDAAVSGGARGVSAPTTVGCRGSDENERGTCRMAEVELYGDVVLRFVSFGSDVRSSEEDGPFLPHLAPYDGPGSSRRRSSYGIERIDHAVGNVPNLMEALVRTQKATGFHEFAEFTSEDVGTVESGLNSVVLASDSEDVLLPLNEPTEGRRKSQIQTYLEQNEGPGLQHLALKTNDIFDTIAKMRHAEEELGIGFELMKRPSGGYYRDLPDRLGDRLTPDQYERLEELGILADADDEGVLLQIFTKPVGDRPTFFVEIIQRIGCALDAEKEEEEEEGGKEDDPPKLATTTTTPAAAVRQRPGCGGFGQGNFKELFKSIEEHEKTLKV